MTVEYERSGGLSSTAHRLYHPSIESNVQEATQHLLPRMPFVQEATQHLLPRMPFVHPFTNKLIPEHAILERSLFH